MMKIKNSIPIFMIIFILFIGLISFAIRTTRVENELMLLQNELQLKEDALIDTNKNLSLEIKKNNNLTQELNTANVIITSLKSQERIIDTTATVEEIEMIGRTVHGESNGLSKMEQSAVVWCILNYVDAGYGTIAEVITHPGRFHGYYNNSFVPEETRRLVEDVVARWKIEKICDGNVGRTLPSDYLWFHGDGQHNYFRNAYSGEYDIWDWNCYNPYS